jgi:hypothetical protein
MENRWQYVAMGGGESREELEGIIDALHVEEWEVARHYHPGRFDRRATNQRLATLGWAAQGGFHLEDHDPDTHRRCRSSTGHRTDPLN